MLPESFAKLVSELARLPGIGPRGAERIAMHLFKRKNGSLHALSDAILHVRDNLQLCEECFYLSNNPRCRICENQMRDRTTICVVEEIMDVVAIEKTGNYRGLYHVLHGRIAPLKRMGPDDVKLKELLERATKNKTAEIIIATNPDAEGEMTALYIQKLFQKNPHTKLSRIARGIPVGGDITYADDITLREALAGRRELENVPE